jgi:hypothetical protein
VKREWDLSLRIGVWDRMRSLKNIDDEYEEEEKWKKKRWEMGLQGMIWVWR